MRDGTIQSGNNRGRGHRGVSTGSEGVEWLRRLTRCLVPTRKFRRTETRDPVSGRKGVLACLQKKKLCGKRSWTLNGKKKDERRAEEKKESDDVGTREERGGQGSVRVGGQAALNMEADGAETPQGKSERVCREDKKVRGRTGVVLVVRKFGVQYQRW